MIPNRWYAVLDARELPGSRPIGVTRLGEKLVFWRDGNGAPCCAVDRCVHRGVALSCGTVVEGSLECPFHGFRYDPRGRCTLIPSNGKSAPVPERFEVSSYPTREAHGFIWIFHGDDSVELPEIPFFDNLDERFCYTTFHDLWTVHYSRAIENQLDVMHLPFVHHNTIGRGNRTLVDGPLVEWLDVDHFRFYVFNRRDEGSSPLPSSELDRDEAAVHLDFIFPNIWQNYLGDKMSVMAAFAPIDEENTMIYLRLYQRIVRIRVLREIFMWFITRFNTIILSQDKRVVLTQRPRKTALNMGENLVAGDAPIIAFRRRRQELIDAVNGVERP